MGILGGIVGWGRFAHGASPAAAPAKPLSSVVPEKKSAARAAPAKKQVTSAPALRVRDRQRSARMTGSVSLAGAVALLADEMIYAGAGVVVEGHRYPWLAARLAVGGGWLTADRALEDSLEPHEKPVFSLAVGALFHPWGLATVRRFCPLPQWLRLYGGPEVQVFAARALVAVTVHVVAGAQFRLGSHWRLGAEVGGGWNHVLTETYAGDLDAPYNVGTRVMVGYGW
jgi:hypothetical protein